MFKCILTLQFRKVGERALCSSHTLYRLLHLPFPPCKDLIIVGKHPYKIDEIVWDETKEYFLLREHADQAISFNETWDSRKDYFVRNGW